MEKFKRKNQDEEMKIISEKNQQYEEDAKHRIEKLSSDIKILKQFIRENTYKVEDLKKELENREKKYEEDCAILSLHEAQELLFNNKEKGKKVIKAGEEKQYFIKKEKIRQLKQELHKTYQEE